MTITATFSPGEVARRWYVVDATNKTLGRLATRIVIYLRGKHKPEFTSNIDQGDYVIVVNANKINVTGNKRADKLYWHYTGYASGLKQYTFEALLQKHPEKIIERAVKGMLPRGSLGRDLFKKLKVYAGPTHEHAAQNPETIDL